ncbi:polysaccharide biosynthesis/export family protein [Desulfonema magnum]|uniref:Polysaccharide export protein domain-containing protein n=1 Tax=Desulfonema magnum TaxID=45655 RepID=A0A975GRB3_9BACT|nr:polysaccharide biosynthesis/export family protein [Desulfonema magnum]QTA90747.1 Polysaccharide export protein domain-containing protein [Desulfonema magnum]
MKTALHILLTFFLFSCGGGGKDRHAVPLVENDSGPVPEYFHEYRLMSGDLLDIIYKINLIKTDKYRLNTADVVEIRFPSMSDHNTQQVIRSDGMITLPYVGDISVIGLTTQEAAEKLREAYKTVLRFPDIYLLLKEESGARIRELRRVITSFSQGQTRVLTVRPDGVITFPLIGDMSVAGKTIPEVSEAVNQSYKQQYPELQADIILSETAGFFVYVFGEVGRPGAYEMKQSMTLIKALAMAGGPKASARLRNVALSHRKGSVMECRIIDLEARLKGEKKCVSQLLRPDDIIYVPKRPLATAAQIAKEISGITFFRGFSLGASWKLDDE